LDASERKGSKKFFFEKKNQKTFINLARAGETRVVPITKVFSSSALFAPFLSTHRTSGEKNGNQK
jgi:hypothetical protein